MSAKCQRTGSSSIVITREYRATPERVWEAWTNPDLLVQWFGTPGYTLERVNSDLRPGGQFEKHFRTEDGERFIVGGQYRTVVPFESLVYTWTSLRSNLAVTDSLVTLEFEATKAGTLLTLRHDGLMSEPLIRVHETGWIGNLNQLAPFTERGFNQDSKEHNKGL